MQKFGISPCHDISENFCGIMILFLEFGWLVGGVSAHYVDLVLLFSCAEFVFLFYSVN